LPFKENSSIKPLDKLQQKPKDELRIQIDSKIEPFAPAPAKKQPGFETIYSIACLSIMAYLKRTCLHTLK
jgi:hypothetical protein